MDETRSLFEPGGPVFHAVEMDLPAFRAQAPSLRARHAATLVRTLDGAQCRTALAFFGTIAAALEFPTDRVGWNSLNDRLHDLTWLPAPGYLLLVEEAGSFLADEADTVLGHWHEIMALHLAQRYTPGRPVAPRKVLMQVEPGGMEGLLARWARIGAQVSVVGHD